MPGETRSKSAVSRPSGDPYLTISRVSIILSKLAQMVPSPRPYRSGLVVRSPAWDPRGARFDSSCVFKPRCFWGGAKAFSAGKIPLPQNYIRGPRIFMNFGGFGWFCLILGTEFDSWCMFKPRCFWGGAKAFAAGKIDLSQNKIGVPLILIFFWHFFVILGVLVLSI